MHVHRLSVIDVLSVHALINLTLSLLFTHMPPTPTPSQLLSQQFVSAVWGTLYVHTHVYGLMHWC